MFVTDAQMRNSLAIIRSLGKKGLFVTAGEETRFATGFFSKYCSNIVVYPSPRYKKEEFVLYMLNLFRKDNYQVFFPITDYTILPIIEHRDKFSKYTTIALPPNEIFFNAYDKGITIKKAIKIGVPCPKTYFIEGEDYYKLKSFSKELSYPIVLKPRMGFGRRGVRICNSPIELLKYYKILLSQYGKLLIQEFIPLEYEFGVYTLFNFSSEPCALSVQRRIRSYPINGGPSTFRETFKNELTERAVEMAFKLLKHLKWVGVAMVEFRVDARDGTPKLMEINPRFWGSLQLSILAGIDFPYLLYKLFTEGNIEKVLDYKVGVKCRWLFPGDFLWLLTSPNKLKNLKEFVKFRTNYDIFTLTDIGPTLGLTLATARYLFDRKMWSFIIRR
ncbi:MAG: ATP-grasp domain-containing protein [Nitrososphaeria archaeon]|nr:ATP-grasp domain-containing protein [Nitrososphaeria archaeon]